jgi:phosphatidylserine/phosphatidylglycerophosphate/cardiolipin synthase-like enzyme
MVPNRNGRAESPSERASVDLTLSPIEALDRDWLLKTTVDGTRWATNGVVISMARFLDTSATNFYLEELIRNAKDRLILISPFLRINDRIKELLEDKNRRKIDVRIVYGKNELHAAEIDWLKDLPFIRTRFCKNLHAKCYLNEELCIITSLHLYAFSQVNNNEMGVLLSRADDAELFAAADEEAQRIIRISSEVRMTDEVRMPLEAVMKDRVPKAEAEEVSGQLSSSRFA